MAIQLRTTLKGYFQTGNIPVEQHYIDFIDSTLSITESNSGNIDLEGNISMSGDISASGVTGHHILGGEKIEFKGIQENKPFILADIELKRIKIFKDLTAPIEIPDDYTKMEVK